MTKDQLIGIIMGIEKARALNQSQCAYIWCRGYSSNPEVITFCGTDGAPLANLTNEDISAVRAGKFFVV